MGKRECRDLGTHSTVKMSKNFANSDVQLSVPHLPPEMLSLILSYCDTYTLVDLYGAKESALLVELSHRCIKKRFGAAVLGECDEIEFTRDNEQIILKLATSSKHFPDNVLHTIRTPPLDFGTVFELFGTDSMIRAEIEANHFLNENLRFPKAARELSFFMNDGGTWDTLELRESIESNDPHRLILHSTGPKVDAEFFSPRLTESLKSLYIDGDILTPDAVAIIAGAQFFVHVTNATASTRIELAVLRVENFMDPARFSLNHLTIDGISESEVDEISDRFPPCRIGSEELENGKHYTIHDRMEFKNSKGGSYTGGRIAHFEVDYKQKQVEIYLDYMIEMRRRSRGERSGGEASAE